MFGVPQPQTVAFDSFPPGVPVMFTGAQPQQNNQRSTASSSEDSGVKHNPTRIVGHMQIDDDLLQIDFESQQGELLAAGFHSLRVSQPSVQYSQLPQTASEWKPNIFCGRESPNVFFVLVFFAHLVVWCV
jgi:hypothetical protein